MDLLVKEIHWRFNVGSRTTIRVTTNIGYFNRFIEEVVNAEEFSNNCQLHDFHFLQFKELLCDMFIQFIEVSIYPQIAEISVDNDNRLLNEVTPKLTIVRSLDGVLDEKLSFEANVINMDFGYEMEDEYEADFPMCDIKDLDDAEYNSIPGFVALLKQSLGEEAYFGDI
jgi:hypothetical protein